MDAALIGIKLSEALRQALQLGEGGTPAKRVLAGEQLIEALESGPGEIDANVVLRGATSAEAAVRQVPAGLCIRGCLVVAEVEGASLALPPGLTVEGGVFWVKGSVSWLFTSSPVPTGTLSFGEGLKVGGVLHISECPALTSLPKNLHVDGDVDLSLCTVLTSVPEGVHVGGNLDLTWCTSLASLGEGLRVGGNLVANSCKALGVLPEDMEVGKNMSFCYCEALAEQHRHDMDVFLRRLQSTLERGPGSLQLARWDTLTTLPEGFKVNGSLDLTRCSALVTLPAGLHVGGSLTLNFSTLIESLPEELHVGGNLNMLNCTSVTSLAEGLHVNGNLNLAFCTGLTRLPSELHVGGDLSLGNCGALTNLPEDLRVGGTLDLSGCKALEEQHCEDMGALLERLQAVVAPSGSLQLRNWETLESIPEGFSIGGALNLSNCTALTSLPDGLCVDGSLDLFQCRALVTLPERLHVGSDLLLVGCSSLSRLPQQLQVGGNVALMWCSSLTSLPDDLHIRGNLGMHWCTALASLPRGLRVDESLALVSCTALASLPDDLQVGGSLNLQDCSSLESLPASILEWLPRESGEIHDVYLAGSGLSLETLEWLREADAPGLRFHVNLASQDDRARPGFATAKEAAAFWAKEASLDLGEELAPSEDATLVQFLSRLRDAKEFGVAETRQALAKRIIAVLELLSAQDEVREELLLRMSDSLDACNDKPVWALNQMHLVVEVAKVRGDAAALRDLGRRVMRLMVVHEHAKRKIDSLKWVDDVCVYLRFEIDLREALDLPVGASAMIFPSYIKVDDAELESAKNDALAISEDQFQAWLAEWPEWQRQKRHEVVSKLDQDWTELPAVKQRQSVRKRLSRRLSRLVSVTGDKMVDPVTLDLGKSVWSLGDLLRHWERTGMDLHNVVTSPEQLQRNLRRVF